VKTNNGNFNWGFPLTERFQGEIAVPVTFDIWIATVHFDLIDPNLITLKAPYGTHWILFLFAKSQRKGTLSLK
jgi:hypothetical protein